MHKPIAELLPLFSLDNLFKNTQKYENKFKNIIVSEENSVFPISISPILEKPLENVICSSSVSPMFESALETLKVSEGKLEDYNKVNKEYSLDNKFLATVELSQKKLSEKCKHLPKIQSHLHDDDRIENSSPSTIQISENIKKNINHNSNFVYPESTKTFNFDNITTKTKPIKEKDEIITNINHHNNFACPESTKTFNFDNITIKKQPIKEKDEIIKKFNKSKTETYIIYQKLYSLNKNSKLKPSITSPPRNNIPEIKLEQKEVKNDKSQELKDLSGRKHQKIEENCKLPELKKTHKKTHAEIKLSNIESIFNESSKKSIPKSMPVKRNILMMSNPTFINSQLGKQKPSKKHEKNISIDSLSLENKKFSKSPYDLDWNQQTFKKYFQLDVQVYRDNISLPKLKIKKINRKKVKQLLKEK